MIAHTGRVIVTARAITLPVSRNASRLRLGAGTHKDDCLSGIVKLTNECGQSSCRIWDNESMKISPLSMSSSLS